MTYEDNALSGIVGFAQALSCLALNILGVCLLTMLKFRNARLPACDANGTP